MDLVIFLDFVISDPDGAETGGLSGHHVDSVTEVDREFLDTGASELKNLILDETALKYFFDKRDGHIVRSNSVLGLTESDPRTIPPQVARASRTY